MSKVIWTKVGDEWFGNANNKGDQFLIAVGRNHMVRPLYLNDQYTGFRGYVSTCMDRAEQMVEQLEAFDANPFADGDGNAEHKNCPGCAGCM